MAIEFDKLVIETVNLPDYLFDSHFFSVLSSFSRITVNKQIKNTVFQNNCLNWARGNVRKLTSKWGLFV